MNYLSRTKSRFTHEYRRFRSYIGRPKMVVQTKPVILSHNNLCDRPIFLIGVHRSGTSLCRRIIDSHSNIACPPETFFLEHFAEMVRDRNTWAGFHGLGFEKEPALEEIKKWSTQYHEAYRIAQSKSRWADKTPQYVAMLPEIEQLFGSKVQYLMIFRHPLDVVYSIFKRGWRFGNFDPDLLINTAIYVSQSVKKQLEFMQKNPDLCFRLHYENLIDSPENTLKAVFKFLEEPWEIEVLDYNNSPHGFGTEDPVVRGTKGFMPNFENWKALSEEQLSTVIPIVEDIVKDLGYNTNSLESKTDSPLLTR